MKTEKNILIAFLLNFGFSMFELLGGFYTGSVAILSDAVHDMGDAASIGLSYFLEKKSKQQPDDAYTYGYARYSVLGSVITTLVLLLGSFAVIGNAVRRVITPVEIDYGGMIVFAVIGVVVNAGAAFFTHGGGSLNQKAVNLHMLEDVLGWIVVLVGAVVMKVTNLAILDPVLSIAVAGFIIVRAWKGLREVLNLFFEKTPHTINIKELKEHLEGIEGVQGIHHVHLWSLDGRNHYVTMHVVTDSDTRLIKGMIREELREHGIGHATLELETGGEYCLEEACHVEPVVHTGHHH